TTPIPPAPSRRRTSNRAVPTKSAIRGARLDITTGRFATMASCRGMRLLLVLVLVGCDSGGTTLQPDAAPPDAPIDGACLATGDGGAADAGVSFHTDLLPFFQNICANAECHGGGAGNLDLTAGHEYTSLVGVPAQECMGTLRYVDPGHPETSYIVDKLRGSICHCMGERMPLGGPYFTPAQLALFIDWIAEGAPNN